MTHPPVIARSQHGRTNTQRLGVAAFALVLILGTSAATAIAQEGPVRVTISTSGRTVLDSLFDTIKSKGGLTTQPAVRYAKPLQALRDFCRNEANSSPDIVLGADHMEVSLAAECAKNNADPVIEVELARNALILAVRTGDTLTSLTSRLVYLAVAREVPYRDDLTRNTAVRWVDVDPSLPLEDIHFQLPMRDEASRAAFDMAVLQGGCRNEPAVKGVFDAEQRTRVCITPRYDRVRELPRTQALKALLEAPVGTVAVLSQRDIAQAGDQVVGLVLDGMSPTPDAIRQASYDVSSSFWLYAKRRSPDAIRIIELAMSDAIIGPDGPLPALGLLPLPAEERAAQRAAYNISQNTYGVGVILSLLATTGADAWHMFLAPRVSMPANMANALDFTSLMDIAGYEISAIRSSIGIIPDAGMTFGIAREMSDADYHYLDRILYRHSLAHPGAIAAMQRRVIRSILEVRELDGFEVSKVEIDFLPLPKVVLEVTPKGSSYNRSSSRNADGQ